MPSKISTSRRKSDGKPRKLRKVKNIRSARRQARRLVEVRIGRKLKKKELVHHKDGKTTNNSPKNLKVVRGQRRHGRIHPGK
ncbi:hypothetical protein LCGC14_1624200 [marine sediment metagenome]|uniref:HNH nuclease domain-containing protein n=1 Tax=marine sediment metagenome TaxID=412755 RepID=A0A0F9L498_9ZZZZ